MESRHFGGGRPRGGRGKSNFGSRDYRMEGRREQNSSRGGGGGGRYGNSGGGGKHVYPCLNNIRQLFIVLSVIFIYVVIYNL